MPVFAGGTSLNTIERCGLEIRYLRITSGPNRGQYVHRLVAAAMLGRPLREDEEVDHKNGDTLDNEWTNLQVISTIEHAKITRARHTAKRAEARRAREAPAAHGEDVPF